MPLSLTVMYSTSYARSILNFSSWVDFAESGTQEALRYLEFWEDSSTLENLSQNSTSQKFSDIEVVWKIGVTSIHMLLIVYGYSLAILLEVLIFIMCFIVCQIGYDFWNAIEVDLTSLTLAKVAKL